MEMVKDGEKLEAIEGMVDVTIVQALGGVLGSIHPALPKATSAVMMAVLASENGDPQPLESLTQFLEEFQEKTMNDAISHHTD